MNIITLYTYVTTSDKDQGLLMMHACDVPDAIGRLFPPFPAPGRWPGPEGRGQE